MRRAFVMVLLAAASVAVATAQDIDFDRTILMFHSDACPHCARQSAWIDSIEQRYPLLEFVEVEIETRATPESLALFESTMRRFNSTTAGWPRLVADERVFIGFTPGEGPETWAPSYFAFIGYENQIRAALDRQHARLARQQGVAPTAPLPGATSQQQSWALPTALVLGALGAIGLLVGAVRKSGDIRAAGLVAFVVGVFLAGLSLSGAAVSGWAAQLPFPAFVVAIAAVDGFNPCAFAVLFILLSLLSHTKDRFTMIAVGATFVAASALVYFVVMSIMIGVGAFATARFGGIVLRIIGLAVVGFGVVNLWDGIRGTTSFTLSLSETQKRRAAERSAKIARLAAGNTLGTRLVALGGTAVLALTVNLVELGCTAILPAVYMSGLISRFGTDLAAPHVLWTLVYSGVYVLPLAAIVAAFVYNRSSNRLSARGGRALKLAGGAVMAVGGIALAVNPAVFGI